MAGALPERVFRKKLERAGFVSVQSTDERVYGIDDCERYPLFTPALIGVMRRVIPAERQDRVARALVFLASKP